MWKSFLVSVVLIAVVAWAPGCNGNKIDNRNGSPPVAPIQIRKPDAGQFDPNRVEEFFGEFKKDPKESSDEQASLELDQRIHDANLSLADKIEVLRRLAPRRDWTLHKKELRMERLILSVSQTDLPLFKFSLDYDGDNKDMAEYVFHDIDNKGIQARIKAYFRTVQKRIGIKVLTDVDDTMYASLLEARYPKKQEKDGKAEKVLYPGVLEFYDALKSEPFDVWPIPVTTLSARPKSFEESSLNSLVEITKGKLRPSALSGELASSTLGTLESLARALLKGKLSHKQEDQIGRVKFENFSHFSEIYPEYSYVFVGDSGQADALAARLMVSSPSTDPGSRVLITFLHDIRRFANDGASASDSFLSLLQDRGLIVSETPGSGRGVIVFRNYIQAALIAFARSDTLKDLITAEELAAITKAALEQFLELAGKETGGAFGRLREEYGQDAKRAYQLLTNANPTLSDLGDIRRILDEKF